MSSTQENSFAILSAIGQAAIDERQEELARFTEHFEERWLAAGGGGLRTPSLGGTSTTGYLGVMLDHIQESHRALGMEEYNPPTVFATPPPPIKQNFISPSQLLAAQLQRSSTLSIPPPPPLVRVNAFASPFRQRSGSVEEGDLMNDLRTFRSQLQLTQDDCYKDCFSSAEIDAAEAEHAELGRKIAAIEQCMLAFGAIFRTR